MRHDQAADEPGRNTPGGAPHVFEATGRGLILHVERLGEILAEVVRCPCLDRLVVLHERFDRVGAQRSSELLTFRFQTGEDGHGQPLFVEAAINPQDQTRLTLRVRFIDVRGVPFLPQELRRSQKRARAQLPAHDVGPLIQEQRQVAVALDPFRIHRVDDGFRRGSHDERLLECRGGVDGDGVLPLFAGGSEARVCDQRDFLREPLDVLRFLRQQTHRDEQREIRVTVARGAQHIVERTLHQFPDAIAIGPDDHRAADGGIVSELRLLDDVGVPLAKVLRAWRDSFRLSH